MSSGFTSWRFHWLNSPNLSIFLAIHWTKYWLGSEWTYGSSLESGTTNMMMVQCCWSCHSIWVFRISLSWQAGFVDTAFWTLSVYDCLKWLHIFLTCYWTSWKQGYLTRNCSTFMFRTCVRQVTCVWIFSTEWQPAGWCLYHTRYWPGISWQLLACPSLKIFHILYPSSRLVSPRHYPGIPAAQKCVSVSPGTLHWLLGTWEWGEGGASGSEEESPPETIQEKGEWWQCCHRHQGTRHGMTAQASALCPFKHPSQPP